MAAELSSILSSVETLTKIYTEPENAFNPPNNSYLIQRLNFNLTAYRARNVSKFFSRSRRDVPASKLTSGSETLQVYVDFTKECLSLLSLLDETLTHLFKKDREEAEKRRPLLPTKALLSVSQLRSINVLLQFTVSLGIYPYLQPMIDNILRMKLMSVRSVEKFDQLSDKRKSFLLYKSLRVLINVLHNPVVGAIVSSKHLSDIFAALIQICYSPNSPCDDCPAGRISTARVASPGDIGLQNISSKKDEYEISTIQHEWCVEALQKIVRKLYQPLVIKELLALQSLSSPDEKKKSVKLSNCDWVRRVCGQLLSERLMDKNGVQHVLKAVYDSTGKQFRHISLRCMFIVGRL